MSCPRSCTDRELIHNISIAKPTEKVNFPNYRGKEKCTWSISTKEKNPHGSIANPSTLESRGRIMDNILEAIGQTPLVRCSRIAEKDKIKCEILGKCEYFNAGGSIKDRASLRMVLEAEEKKILHKNDYILEPTSGNMGMGLCLTAAIKGYKVLITLPEKMSGEKVNMMKALGANILRTPTEAAWNDSTSHIGLAIRIQEKLHNCHILDQYKNIANPMAHYEWTAQEILEQCGDKFPDAIIVSAGTGGTITGISRKFREEGEKRKKKCYIVGVDPVGSILALPEKLNENPKVTSYEIEGIGYDFIPSVLDRDGVDEWIKTEDEESFINARKLIRYEGLMIGGSSGSAYAGALKFIKKMGWENDSTKRVIIILPDGSRNYMSKFLDDHWLFDRGIDIDNYLVEPTDKDEIDKKEKSMLEKYTCASLPTKQLITVHKNDTCNHVINVMRENKIQQLPVVCNDSNELMGAITEQIVFSKIIHKLCTKEDTIERMINKKIICVQNDCTLNDLSKHLELNNFVLITEKKNNKHYPTNIVTRLDLTNFLFNLQN